MEERCNHIHLSLQGRLMFTCTTLGMAYFHMKSLSCTALQNLRNPPSLMSMGHDIPTSELISQEAA